MCGKFGITLMWSFTEGFRERSFRETTRHIRTASRSTLTYICSHRVVLLLPLCSILSSSLPSLSSSVPFPSYDFSVGSSFIDLYFLSPSLSCFSSPAFSPSYFNVYSSFFYLYFLSPSLSSLFVCFISFLRL